MSIGRPGVSSLAADDLDVYVAFRTAFLGHPEVRIFTRDPREVSSRFVQMERPCRVFLYDERSDDPQRNTPKEAPFAASTRGPAYDDAAHWAEITRAWWDGEPISIVRGRAVSPHGPFELWS